MTALLCGLVGVMLGMVGSGGSLLIVPIFVFVSGMSMSHAIATSLPVVGSASLVGVYQYYGKKLINTRLVVAFVFAGTATSFLGAALTKQFDDNVLLSLFGILMSIIGVVLLVNKNKEDALTVCRPNIWISLLVGCGIGFLTGFLGVGGGFLIVPAISLLMRCSFQTAVGTSLTIIGINSWVAFLNHTGHMDQKDFRGILFYSLLASLGVIIGGRIGAKFSPWLLKKTLAGVIVCLGIYFIVRGFRF